MTEKLIIHNFGPIKDAEISLGDLTVFVGPQATGKSLTAQILYFFRRLEDLVNPIDPNHEEFDQTIALLDALDWWFGADLSVYSNRDTFLKWQDHEFANGDIHQLNLHDGKVEANEALLERAVKSEPKRQADVYIPSGRVRLYFSFL